VTPIIIVGAGAHGDEVAAYLCDMGLPLAGAVDDNRPKGDWNVTQVIGGVTEMVDFCSAHTEVRYITAFGSNSVRRALVHRIENLGLLNLKAWSLKHTSAWKGADVEIGNGTLLAPHSLVTTRTRVGHHCILNVKASVSHDCIIGDWCNINPAATLCGGVHIGDGCYIGAGVTVIDKRKIGAWTIVGAGAVVTQDLPEGVTAVGVPARIIKRHGMPF